MQEPINKIREETIALIIDECKRYIQDLRRRWEEVGKLREETGKRIADLTKQAEKPFRI